jgi:hypothetical protein
LWSQAQAAYSQKQFPTAKQLAQQVVEKHLDHQNVAQTLINTIEGELKSANEDQEYNDLRQQVEAAKRTPDATTLKNLQARAQNMSNANGKHAGEARNIADTEIPNLLKTLAGAANGAKVQQLATDIHGLVQGGRYREAMSRTNDFSQFNADPNPTRQEIQNAEKQALQILQNDYRSADKKSESALKPLQNRVQQFKDNANSQQDAQSLLETIAKDIAAAQPAVLDEKPAIKAVMDDLSRAFATRKTDEIKRVWPLIPRKMEDTLKASFGAAKSVSRNFTPADITVNGDTATATGTYSGVFEVGGNKTPSSGSFKATLKKQGGRWIVSDLIFM